MFFVSVCLLPAWSAGQESGGGPAGPSTERKSRWLRPFWQIGSNALSGHVGFVTTPLHLAAVGSTVLLVQTDVDTEVQGWAAGHDETVSIAWSAPGLAGGTVVPLLLPAGLLFFSDDEEIADAGAAALQAAALGFGFSTLWKGITNREPPEEGVAAEPEKSRRFDFGFFRQFPFDGWPSSHTMTNMAMGAALAAYYHDTPWAVAAAYGWPVFVAASAMLGMQGRVHWASDVVAGGLMGWAIGHTVGKKFAARRDSAAAGRDNRVSTGPAISLFPSAGRGRLGVLVMAVW